MQKLVRDAMTANPRTIRREATVREAAMMMAEEDVGALPVVDSDQILVGMITDRDIALRVVATDRDPRSTSVQEIATTTISPAYPDEPLSEAVEQMVYRQVRRLPVIEDDRVVGMLAQADVVHDIGDKKAGRLVDAISHPAPTLTIP
ncbi:MAG TPA: CBS domain-containing protein [Gaiellaceae bacterium]|nr:CBS domain-containing protein [Gaiellaceae bacterium]